MRQPDTSAETVLLAATDPANPYGTALPWPQRAARRASRSAGAYVLMENGDLIVFVERGTKRMLTFTEDQDRLEQAAVRLERSGRRRKRTTIETIDGFPARETVLGRLLEQNGFTDSYKGLAYQP